MRRKTKTANVVCSECLCRGYEVIATFDDGCVIAWLNVKLDGSGLVSDRASHFGGRAIPASKIIDDERWRCDNHQRYIDAVCHLLLRS